MERIYTTIIIPISMFICCTSPETLHERGILTKAKRLNELNYENQIYFDRVDFDILKAKKMVNIGEVREDALATYEYTIKFKPDSDSDSSYQSYMSDRKERFSEIPKTKVLDSILYPEAMKRAIEGILFTELASKPYFDKKFDKDICSPDSLAKVHWILMRKQLEKFDNQKLIENFDRIAFRYSDDTYYLPIGLLLMKEGRQLCWYVPIGWEYKDDIPPFVKKGEKKRERDPNCHGLGHILGYIYNFDFSNCLYTFKCG